MQSFTRRNFLKNSTLAAGATFTLASANRVLGANDRINVAVTGIHGRGGHHIREFQNMENVEVISLIDPDSTQLTRRSKDVIELGGKKPETNQDIRKALENPDLDALSIATTNHWHSLSAIWACQAGLDVYVEKPCSHNIYEGRKLVEAARKYGRIVQHGTQSRSSGGWWRLAEHARRRTFGRLKISRGLCYKRRDSIGFEPYEPVPDYLDYNMWLGPTPEQPYNTNLVHYKWHWFWDFGNGDIGNQGVHQMDIARWMIPGATYPKSVISVGGRLGYEDQAQTPNTMVTIFDYGYTQLIFEVRGLPTDDYMGSKRQVMHFEDAYVSDHNLYREGSSEREGIPAVDVDMGPSGPGGHFGNFIAAVRTRDRNDLNAEILEGHLSSMLCHMANISYRVGREFPLETDPSAFTGNDAALDALDRMRSHLKNNNVNLKEGTYRIGRQLFVDPDTERFIDDPRADALATRTYRAPFVVPEYV